MAYNDIEISTQDGRPVALYALRWGQTWWRYTSADRAIEREELVGTTTQTVRYEPIAISDAGMTQGQSAQNDMTVDGPATLPIVDLFRGTPPSQSVVLTIRRMHLGDTEAPINWKGLVMNVMRVGAAGCRIVGKPMIATLKRTGARLCWSRECPHYLYDSGCKENPAEHEQIGEVTSMTATRLTVKLAEYPEVGWFNGGFLSWEANEDGTLDRRMIERDELVGEGANQRIVLSIFGTVDRIAVGTALKLYPGCDRLPGTCDGKFNNLENFGGFQFMPGESPFEGPIW